MCKHVERDDRVKQCMTILWMGGEIKLTLGGGKGKEEERGRGEVDNTRSWLPSTGKRGISGDNYAARGNGMERVDATAISAGTVGGSCLFQ